MAYIKTPSKNESILQWAREITKEVNSLQPSPGEGINLTKTGAGTTYSINKYGVPHADSMPYIIGGEVGDNVLSGLSNQVSGVYATTYSIETGPQNSFSLFEFNKNDNLMEYSLSALDMVDFVVRDRTPEGRILSGNTLRYSNFANLFTSVVPVEVISWRYAGQPFSGARFRTLSSVTGEAGSYLYFPQVSQSMTIPRGAAVLAHKMSTMVVGSSNDNI